MHILRMVGRLASTQLVVGGGSSLPTTTYACNAVRSGRAA